MSDDPALVDGDVLLVVVPRQSVVGALNQTWFLVHSLNEDPSFSMRDLHDNNVATSKMICPGNAR